MPEPIFSKLLGQCFNQSEIASYSTNEGLLGGSFTVCASDVTCHLSTLSMQLGPETLNIHAICQMSTGIRWLVPRVCVGPPLVTIPAYCALLSQPDILGIRLK